MKVYKKNVNKEQMNKVYDAMLKAVLKNDDADADMYLRVLEQVNEWKWTDREINMYYDNENDDEDFTLLIYTRDAVNAYHNLELVIQVSEKYTNKVRGNWYTPITNTREEIDWWINFFEVNEDNISKLLELCNDIKYVNNIDFICSAIGNGNWEVE